MENVACRARDYCTSGRHVVSMCINVIKVSVYLQVGFPSFPLRVTGSVLWPRCCGPCDGS